MDEFGRRLRDARLEVSHAIKTADAELAGLENERPVDELDDAARTLACGLLARLEDRDHAALDEVRKAEARLADGTYGVCETCARFIPVARLRALPTARRCVACEALAEAVAG